MAYLQITRTGLVTTTLTSENQCKNKGHKAYFYTIKLKVASTSLDEDGFIVDHFDLAGVAIITLSFGTMDSCEKLCIQLAENVRTHLPKLHIVEVYVKIQPQLEDGTTSPAYMEYSESGDF